MFFKKSEKKSRPPLDPVAIETVVKNFVASRTELIRAGEITADTKLFSSGLLDSLSFIQMVTTLEGEFDVRMSDGGAVSADTLDSLDHIVAAVVRARQAA